MIGSPFKAQGQEFIKYILNSDSEQEENDHPLALLLGRVPILWFLPLIL